MNAPATRHFRAEKFDFWSFFFSGLTGLAPIAELHYNHSLNSSDPINRGGFQIGNAGNNIEVINMTLGSTMQFGVNTTLTLAYTAPVGGDRQFDGELRVIFNHRFGSPTRASRVGF